ncbi:MAG: hypothetical protein HEQ35_05640 [Gloeotrichia echinulata IR180]
MTLKELIEKLSELESQSNGQSFVWLIHSRAQIRDVFLANDGAVIIASQWVYYEDKESHIDFIIDVDGNHYPIGVKLPDEPA